MKLTILCVGKLKEKYWQAAIAEYCKRLSRYCKLTIVEVADEKTPENMSSKEEKIVRQKEGERLLQAIKEDDMVVALAIDGKETTSEGFSRWMENQMVSGTSSFVFVIGGSIGLSEEVMKRSDFSLSFSKMTFPHQLMRVILLEQIYRGYKIMKNEPYHK